MMGMMAITPASLLRDQTGQNPFLKLFKKVIHFNKKLFILACWGANAQDSLLGQETHQAQTGGSNQVSTFQCLFYFAFPDFIIWLPIFIFLGLVTI